MFWRVAALCFFVGGFIVLPLWSYSQGWSFWPAGFCFFVTVLLLIVSLVSARGSRMWRSGGQRPPGT